MAEAACCRSYVHAADDHRRRREVSQIVKPQTFKVLLSGEPHEGESDVPRTPRCLALWIVREHEAL